VEPVSGGSGSDRPRSQFDSGVKEGHIDSILKEHEKRLAAINGNIQRFAESIEKLDDDMRSGLDGVASDIRSMQEHSRLAEERVKVAATTLATETERRRAELETTATTSDRAFSKHERIIGLMLTVAALLITVYFSLH
jgi:hypothetical protein